MENITLYVKSEKIPIVQFGEGISGHPCTGAYRVKEIIENFKPEDREAMELLDQAKVSYKLVNLSDCSFITQLKAKILGINETPTLIFESEKIKGIQNIRQRISQIKR